MNAERKPKLFFSWLEFNVRKNAICVKVDGFKNGNVGASRFFVSGPNGSGVSDGG